MRGATLALVLACACLACSTWQALAEEQTGVMDVLGTHTPRNVPDETYLVKLDEEPAAGSSVKRVRFSSEPEVASGFQVTL
eukprot:CAMPEP_0202917356 /NCGR_PEP_ID=MMETSP1392-20130828/70813_1 /ASSEMBLY_ACC=CAM_ASM_000868 /TAXON_ID=225041 /ORGANISM="Chlamydomonas chlamydogama, Strain SAG 11-48b" /LENGTH=80 /DNA_ID=CAMNT_0049610087 /DNA_START=20 /DNA_END=258 /DNA_ORIENTATION=+